MDTNHIHYIFKKKYSFDRIRILTYELIRFSFVCINCFVVKKSESSIVWKISFLKKIESLNMNQNFTFS